MINVTKTFLPPFEEYTKVLQRAWDNGWITNNGELLQELEQRLKERLGVKHLFFCSNGTVVLQIALKALNITGEVITTPFSYVATTGALLWENCTPVFVDIDRDNFCIDPNKIEASISNKTQAILATHVYGYPCDIERIRQIASKYNLKVIYDGAHAFGTEINSRSVLSYGDISTCSFHATKIFHTGEGGCIITDSDDLAQQILLFRQFGHIGDEHFTVGINGKNSELHAAIGLCNLKYLPQILESRKQQWLYYKKYLPDSCMTLSLDESFIYNYSYFPVIFESEAELLDVLEFLKSKEIYPRRYFYPSLNELSYLKDRQTCPISENISKRVLCLPLYYGLESDIQAKILAFINSKICIS